LCKDNFGIAKTIPRRPPLPSIFAGVLLAGFKSPRVLVFSPDEFLGAVLVGGFVLDLMVVLVGAAASEVAFPPDACGCADTCDARTTQSTAVVISPGKVWRFRFTYCCFVQ
jgi:hypothetical protein